MRIVSARLSLTALHAAAFVAALTCLVGVSLATAQAEGQRILVQSTTSTQNSGLYDHLIPLFEAETGWRVAVIAVGTGQAIRNAAAGDADVLLVHAKSAEDAFVAAGHGVARLDLMYNDFVLIGPADDPLRISEVEDLSDALEIIATSGVAGGVFVSRGDDSGTHRKELALWAAHGADPANFGPWYRETGSGMGATIRVATQMGAYVLTDRATWLAYGDKGDHRIVFDGDPALFNQYGVIAVNPETHPHVNAAGASDLIAWLTGPTGQSAIASYKRDGEQLFFPNAAPVTD
ncbi:MAG: substrate-binding domain-containing protein [Pseudomonadota bacterium]